jgi:crossover junction endodeoxyribonuclease RuvC
MTSSEPCVILGVDPGTVVTGYAIISIAKGAVTPIDFGCVRPPKKESLGERYHIIFQSICHLLRQHTPHEVAVETPFVCQNPQSALKLGGALGCIIIAAKECKIPIFRYSPGEIKKGIAGHGGGSKEDVATILRAMLRLNFSQVRADATDALAIAVHHSNCRLAPDNLKKRL